MKKILTTLLLLVGISNCLNAQWTSPGDGTSYTMNDLVSASNGTVTGSGDTFTIHGDLTISANDGLVINDEVLMIYVEDALITINGSWTCQNEANRVRIYGSPTFKMRFENASDCQLTKMYFSDGSGIQVIESDVSFIDCKFLYFTREYCNAAVNFMNCNPIFDECIFMLNYGAAISSPANGQGSPTITDCRFEANVVDSINSPQINLGPGADDTIRIVNNVIIDDYADWRVGGIAISDLLGTGSTKVLLQDNQIRNGRYGYNQQGINISSLVIGNQFTDNHFESNPMNGGSGISIYGYSTECKAILRNNIITGNLWGITAIYLHDIDLGTEDDWGNNEIHDNGNGGVIYDLYDNSACDITAIGNNWGATLEEEVEDHIFHQVDDPSLGLVTFTPFIGYTQIGEPTVDLQDLDLTKATLYTITGQKVDASSVKTGVYLIEVSNGPKKKYHKIFIK